MDTETPSTVLYRMGKFDSKVTDNTAASPETPT